jgi:hypothetical protein
MSDSDELTVLAQAYMRSRTTMPQNVRDAFANIPKAPLAEVAEELIVAQPDSELIPLLKCIAEINQGRVEDLSMPVFQSYLISECDTDEIQLRRVTNAIKSFLAINALSDTALMAARDEDNSGRKSVTKAEIQRLAKKRKK